jgi:hypothetical protein
VRDIATTEARNSGRLSVVAVIQYLLYYVAFR